MVKIYAREAAVGLPGGALTCKIQPHRRETYYHSMLRLYTLSTDLEETKRPGICVHVWHLTHCVPVDRKLTTWSNGYFGLMLNSSVRHSAANSFVNFVLLLFVLGRGEGSLLG